MTDDYIAHVYEECDLDCRYCGNSPLPRREVPTTSPFKKQAKSSNEAIPHVWHTTDADGGDCRHLAMCRDGAIQAHLLHNVMMEHCKVLIAMDEGMIGRDTERDGICFDPLCVLYGLQFQDKSTADMRAT